MRLRSKLSLPSTLIIGVILGNIFFWRLPVIGTVFTAGYALLLGYALGKKIFPQEESGAQTLLGFLLLIAFWTILGGALFYFIKLDEKMVIILLLAPLIFLSDKILEPKMDGPEPMRLSFISLVSGGGFILLEFAALFLLVRSGTASALRSPWERVPDQFFLIFFLASLGLLLLTDEKKKSVGRIIFTITHAAIIFSVAILVFDAGFGFDPFVHRATESYILEHGTITPKSPYYAGEYALIVFLARTTFLSAEGINKLFLPFFAAFALPLLTLWVFEKRTRENSNLYALAPLAPFILFLFPHSSFISTTPQGIANLFLLFSILTGFAQTGRVKGLLPTAIFGVAALITHPLAGIPAVIFFALLLLASVRQTILRWTLLFFTTIVSSLLIPLIFFLLHLAGRAGATFNPTALLQTNLSDIMPRFLIPFRFNFLLDLAYLYKWNLLWLIIVSALGGFFLLKKNLPHSSNSPFILASFAVFVNSLLLGATTSFPALIDYEQGAYALRLREISTFFLLPLSILGIAWFYERSKRNLTTRIFSLLLLPATMTVALYLTYPRTDKYESTHGYNTSLADIHAVQEIEKDAKEEKYIVLSNQAMGAAALQEFGFKNFYKTNKDEIYFYSVPTGGPLYPYYLKMVYKNGGRETMNEAMDLAGVKLGYIAINHYWTDAHRLTEDFSTIADKEIVVDGGRVYVYKFER